MKTRSEKKPYSHFSNIRFMLRRIWGWDKALLLAKGATIPVNVALPLILIYFPKLLIDAIGRHISDSALLWNIAAICIAIAVMDVAKRALETRAQYSRYSICFRLQQLISYKRMTTDYENVDDPSVAAKEEKANDFRSNVGGEQIVEDISRLLTNLLGSFTYGGMLAALSPVILLMLLASSIISYFVLRAVRLYTEKADTARAPVNRKVHYIASISQRFDYAKDIRLYRMSSWINGLLAIFQMEQLAWIKRIGQKKNLAVLSNVLLRLIRDGVAYALLIGMVLDGRIDLGMFVFYFGAITGFSTWLSTIIEDFNAILDKSLRVGYIREYLDVKDKFNHAKGHPLPAKGSLLAIELRNLTYQYPQQNDAVLDQISVSIKPGEKIAIVGENGAGKTTLVKLLSGLYSPSGGQILVNGQDIGNFNIQEYYSLYSVVFQDVNMIPITIAQFVAGSKTVDRQRVHFVLSQAGLLGAVEKLKYGMDTVLVKGVYEEAVDLSGGEQQKLLFARALYKDAPIMILDEPTAALDPIAESELYEKYNSLTAGKTTIFISHRLASTKFCDRILFLSDRKITECGSHDELMRQNGKYAHMFNVQSHYYKEEVSEHEAV